MSGECLFPPAPANFIVDNRTLIDYLCLVAADGHLSARFGAGATGSTLALVMRMVDPGVSILTAPLEKSIV